jgi:hypothetical protein
MRRSMEWTDKAEGDRPETTYRVSLFAGNVRWQRKEKYSETWETPKLLATEVWERLLEEVDKRYQRRRARHEDVLLVRSAFKDAPKLPPT